MDAGDREHVLAGDARRTGEQPERRAAELRGDAPRRGAKRLGQVLRLRVGEHRGMEGRHLAMRLGGLRRRHLRTLGGRRGRDRLIGGLGGGALERGHEGAGHRADHERHPGAERHLGRPGGDLGACRLLDDLLSEEQAGTDQAAGEPPTRGSLQGDEVAQDPHRVAGTARDEPDETQDDDRVQGERDHADRSELTGLGGFLHGARDRQVPDRQPDHERHRQRQGERRVVAPVPDGEPDLDGPEGRHQPAQPHELPLESCRLDLRAVHRSFPRSRVDTLGRVAAVVP